MRVSTTIGHRGVAIVAHRGASALAPENTLTAIRTAAELGSDLIELDVRRTRDGELILMHDTSLVRTTDARQVYPDRAPWNVRDFTRVELERLDAGAWKSPDFAGERIPTLTEAVELASRCRTGLLLELKAPELYPGIEAEVASCLRRLPDYLEAAAAANQLVVQSFDHGSMFAFKRLEPSVQVGLLGRPALRHLPALALWAGQVSPNHKSIDAGYVAAVHRVGMDCLAWTVDHPRGMNRVIDMGVDGVISNRPRVLHRVLRSAESGEFYALEERVS